MAALQISRWDAVNDVPRSEIVSGLLAEGEVCLLTGQPKSGKSAVALALAAAVATGADFLGRTVMGGGVVYLALERRRSVRRRMAALGLPVDAPLWLAGGTISLIGDATDIVSAIRETAPDARLVVIDTLARATTGLDENSARDMGLVARSLAQIGQELPAAALLLVHHTGKDGTSLRGSSALLGAVDVEIRAEIRKTARSIRVVNANEVAEDQRLDFKLDVVDMPDGGTAVRAVPHRSDGQSMIQQTNNQRKADADDRAREALLHLPLHPFSQSEAKVALSLAGIAEGSDDTRKKQTKRLTDRLVAMGVLGEQDGKLFRRLAA